MLSAEVYKPARFTVRGSDVSVYLSQAAIADDVDLQLAAYLATCVTNGTIDVRSRAVLHVLAGCGGLTGCLAALCGGYVTLAPFEASPELDSTAAENQPSKRLFYIPCSGLPARNAVPSVGSVKVSPIASLKDVATPTFDDVFVSFPSVDAPVDASELVRVCVCASLTLCCSCVDSHLTACGVDC